MYWLALVENVVSLIEDSVLLLEQSPSRAQSLLILAQEEAGKANALYDACDATWSFGGDTITLHEDFLEMERWHHPKIILSLKATDALGPFWGEYARRGCDRRQNARSEIEEQKAMERQARAINKRKQNGFYVDRTGSGLITPQTAERVDLAAEVKRTAGIAEMMLITDHSRSKYLGSSRFGGDTDDLQARLLPYAHPEIWFEIAREYDTDSSSGDT